MKNNEMWIVMASKIRILDEQTINQIAAGEVIENPASVVKELIDNSLDAGATEITVEIKGGGRQLIRITDNGSGMNEDDALLCLERHATSKIKKVDDIQSLWTMGFRGEAIPSIASISKFTLLTCPTESATQTGTFISVEGGKVLKCAPAVRSPGTTIEVKSLFFNVPVRRKFQKAPVYDANEILKMMTSLALANPSVKFELISDLEKPLSTALVPEGDFQLQLAERIRSTLGNEFLTTLVSVSGSCEECRLEGFIGLPAYTRPNRTGQYIFINRRPIVSPLISFAVRDSYGTTLSANRHPIFVLHFTMPGDLVDVNVHPQKKEVRLRQDQMIKEMITNAISTGLQNCGLVHTTEPSFTSYDSIPIDSEPKVEFKPSFHFAKADFTPTPFHAWTSPKPQEPIKAPPIAVPQELFTAPTTTPPPRVLATLPRYVLLDVSTLGEKFSSAMLSKDGLCLIDQKAGHARIIFEKLLKLNKAERHIELQSLLIPYTLEMNAVDSAILGEHLLDLNQIGIEIKEFGAQTYIVDAIPQIFGNIDVATFIKDIVQGMRDVQDDKMYKREIERRIAISASRASMSADRRLTLDEAQMLVNQLVQCEMPFVCPFGKPTIVSLSAAELAKQFQK